MSDFSLKCVRGEWQKLPTHPEACDLGQLASYARRSRRPLAIDLFCGAGGLSLGLQEAGFAVVLGVDSDPVCIETRRANFGGCSLSADVSTVGAIRRIVTAVKGLHVSLLAAAPPCQSFSRAGRSKIRSLDEPVRRRHAERRELWRSIIEVVQGIRADAVLFENVPGMTEGEDITILTRLVEGLERCGYVVQLRRLAARAYGVPQHRERVFAIAVTPGSNFNWPACTQDRVTLRDAISDLPAIEAGRRLSSCEYGSARTPLQKWSRQGLTGKDRALIHDHYARAVRHDDLEAFRLMDHGTKYSDLPDHLKRYRDDIFDDKYKRLAWDDVGRTITAHIAKDGYWYIHPEQHRTLTIREAARIQTFPDRFRFVGTPTHQLRQIGNAVPPLLGARIGQAILECLQKQRRKRIRRPSTMKGRGGPGLSSVRQPLLEWWSKTHSKALLRPWLKAGDLWQLLLGTVLFERQPTRIVRDFWPTFVRRWPTPKAFLADRFRDTALGLLDRSNNGAKLEKIAAPLARGATVDDLPAIKGISAERIQLCLMLATEAGSWRPTVPAVRVAARLLGEEPSNSRMDGQLLLVRVLGAAQAGSTYAALLEIADQFCHVSSPTCENCPLRDHCPSRSRHGRNRDY